MLFSQEYTDFIGRKDELKVLNDFVRNEEKFSWTYVTGQGGIGKSRLLLELCKQIQVDNWVTWFGKEANELFNNLERFNYDLLIIADDEFLKLDDIIDYIKRINSLTSKYKTRIIFINRTTPKNYDLLKNSDPIFQRNLYQNDILYLKGFCKDDFFDFIKSIVLKRNKQIDIDSLNINDFSQIEPYCRPFFGILLGLAIADEKYISNWVETDILEYFYSAEYLKLRKHFLDDENSFEKHLNLIAILIIYKSPTQENIKDLIKLQKEWLPSPNEFLQPFLLNFFIDDPKDNQIVSLYPDILSTYFVLQRFSKLDKDFLYGFIEIESILNFIEKELKNRMYGVTYLKHRIVQDFPENEIGFKILIDYNKDDSLNIFMNSAYAFSILQIISQPHFNDFRKLNAYDNIFEKYSQAKINSHPIMVSFAQFKYLLIRINYNIEKNYFNLKSFTDNYKENFHEQVVLIGPSDDNYDIRYPNSPFKTSAPAVEQDFPLFESSAIREILINNLEIKLSREDLFKRLEQLSREWSEPHIKWNLLLTVIRSDFFEGKNKLLNYIIQIILLSIRNKLFNNIL